MFYIPLIGGVRPFADTCTMAARRRPRAASGEFVKRFCGISFLLKHAKMQVGPFVLPMPGHKRVWELSNVTQGDRGSGEEGLTPGKAAKKSSHSVYLFKRGVFGPRFTPPGESSGIGGRAGARTWPPPVFPQRHGPWTIFQAVSGPARFSGNLWGTF